MKLFFIYYNIREMTIPSHTLFFRDMLQKYTFTVVFLQEIKSTYGFEF
jgi:hypothetical protein